MTTEFNNMLSKLGDLHDAYHGKIAEINAALNTIPAVVAQQMSFQATYDPAEVNPTNERNGTFASLQALIDAAPRGAHITALLPTARLLNMSESVVTVYGGSLRFLPADDNARAQLRFLAGDDGTNNRLNMIMAQHSAGIEFNGCDITLQTKSNAGLPWVGHGVAAIRSREGGRQFSVGLRNTTVKGYAGNALISSYAGSVVSVSTSDSTIDGSMSLLALGSDGVSTISNDNLTIVNGAAIHTGGMVGTNILLK